MSTYRDISGEIAIEARWTNCVICGAVTAQPPVCFDLRCEIELNERGE